MFEHASRPNLDDRNAAIPIDHQRTEPVALGVHHPVGIGDRLELAGPRAGARAPIAIGLANHSASIGGPCSSRSSTRAAITDLLLKNARATNFLSDVRTATTSPGTDSPVRSSESAFLKILRIERRLGRRQVDGAHGEKSLLNG